MTEKQWMANVVELASLLGWLAYHTYDSRRSAPGFPDLVLIRDRVVYAELKTDRGRLAPAQMRCLAALDSAGAEAYVWRPRDLPIVRDALERRVGR